jgi:hypothetical protein
MKKTNSSTDQDNGISQLTLGHRKKPAKLGKKKRPVKAKKMEKPTNIST